MSSHAKNDDNAIQTAEMVNNDLLDLLRKYYILCKQTADKQDIVKNGPMMESLTALLTSGNPPNVLLYVYKILDVLTRDSNAAKALLINQNLRDRISDIVACKIQVQAKLLQKFLIIQSRLLSCDTKNSCKTETPTQQNTANSSKRGLENNRGCIFGTDTKQSVFSFDTPTKIQKRQIEKRCTEIKGVVSVCFHSTDENTSKFLVRSRDISSKAIASAILSCGLEVVKLLVKIENEVQEFEFYADAEELEKEEHRNLKARELPQYLDDNIEIFDPAQCVMTNDEIARENKEGWFRSLTSYLW